MPKIGENIRERKIISSKRNYFLEEKREEFLEKEILSCTNILEKNFSFSKKNYSFQGNLAQYWAK